MLGLSATAPAGGQLVTTGCAHCPMHLSASATMAIQESFDLLLGKNPGQSSGFCHALAHAHTCTHTHGRTLGVTGQATTVTRERECVCVLFTGVGPCVVSRNGSMNRVRVHMSVDLSHNNDVTAFSSTWCL